MSVLDLIPAQYRALAVGLFLLLIAGLGAAGAWTVQAWRYEAQLSAQSAAVARDAALRAQDVLAWLTDAEGKRQALEGRLKANDETHFKELSGVQQNQKVLTSRLATSELRLSVLLAATGAQSGGGGLQAAPGSGGVVHAGTRAELDPAHAQRIVAITGDGDEGLTALAACQGWVREVWEASGGKAGP
jgi:hypothetical protein